MVVIWTPEAGRDLDKIWNYYLPLSPRSAAKIVRDIRNDVAILASGPFVAARERALDDRPEGFRSLVVRRRYKVIYFVDGERATVVAVWDCRRSPVTIRDIFFGKRS